MGIFPDEQCSIQLALVKMLDPRVRVQTYLHIVTYTVYINNDRSRTFIYKITCQKRNHSCENMVQLAKNNWQLAMNNSARQIFAYCILPIASC